MSINYPACRRLQKQGDNSSISFACSSEGGKGWCGASIRCILGSWLCLWNKSPLLPGVLPLWYNLVGIGEVAVDILHLERVSIADLVVCPPVVGCLDHNDITPRATEINCISFAWKLSPDQPERQGRTAEPWQRRQRTDFREMIGLMEGKGSLLQSNKTTHHVVKNHSHKINRKQQSNVYHSF